LNTVAVRFRFAPHVHACLSGTHVVLLDLKRDQYLALDAVESRGLAAVIEDWPTERQAHSEPVTPHAEAAALRLLKDGLLIENSPRSDGPSRTNIAPCTESVLTLAISPRPVIRLKHVLAMIK